MCISVVLATLIYFCGRFWPVYGRFYVSGFNFELNKWTVFADLVSNTELSCNIVVFVHLIVYLIVWLL